MTLDHLPFEAGETVEIIVLANPKTPFDQSRSALYGTVIEYHEPFEPVAAADWDALQ